MSDNERKGEYKRGEKSPHGQCKMFIPLPTSALFIQNIAGNWFKLSNWIVPIAIQLLIQADGREYYRVWCQLRGTGTTGAVLYALLDNGAGAKQWHRQARKALSLTADCLHQTLSYLLFSLLLRSSSLSLSLLYTSLVAGVIKRMQSEIKWRQHWRHSTQIKSYVLRHSLLLLTLLSQTQKHTHKQRQQPTVDMPGWPKSFAL